MSDKQNLTMVSYQNTKPFEYGMTKYFIDNELNIHLKNPSLCFESFQSGESEIALIPVGSLPLLDAADYQIITDFCIGSIDYVRTVCLFSNQPIYTADSVYLDSDSMSSQLLTKILYKHFKKNKPQYFAGLPDDFNLKNNQAMLLIGDKVFDLENNFEYKLDLGHEWKMMTGLPFAFAVWVAKKNVKPEILIRLNESLKFGVQNIDQMLVEQNLVDSELHSYYKYNISFDFDDQKRAAVARYLRLVEELNS